MDFAEFYRTTSPRTLRYAYGLTGDLAQAQDVVQEAYVRAWQRWRRINAYDDTEAWLRLVVSRLAFDWFRHLRVRRNAPQPVPVTVSAPSEDTVLVVAALKKIPERQRHALALHYLLDVPVAEIAADLGVAEGTVKSWLARGRESLTAVLREELDAVRMPTVDDVAERGRRRRRRRVAAAVTAAGLAMLAIVVFATAILGRDRTMPPPPAVAPTGSPMAFSPLESVGSFPIPSRPDNDVVIQNGRAFVVAGSAAETTVQALDLATATQTWGPVSVPMAAGNRFRAVAASGVLAVMNEHEVFALDAATGKILWHKEKDIDPDNVAFFPGTVVYADSRAGEVLGVDPSTGTQLWRIDGQVQSVFGMLHTDDLAKADRGTGSTALVNATPQMFVAGTGGITEYSAIDGRATGRHWDEVPPHDGFVAYNDEIFVRSGREMYRINLAKSQTTRAYAGEGITAMAPCGASDMCLIDATAAGKKQVVAVHDDRVKWTAGFDNAIFIAPVGRALRVVLGIDADTVVLDESGHETLRFGGAASGLIRLDAGNLLAFRLSQAWEAELIGIPVASMRQSQLGTVALTPGSGFAADGSTIVALSGGAVVVYRIS